MHRNRHNVYELKTPMENVALCLCALLSMDKLTFPNVNVYHTIHAHRILVLSLSYVYLTEIILLTHVDKYIVFFLFVNEQYCGVFNHFLK